MPSETNRPAICHVRQNEADEWHYQFIAPNGEKMVAPESFTRRGDAIRAWETMRDYCRGPVTVICDEPRWDPMKPRNRGPRKSDPRPPVKRKTARKSVKR